MRVPSLCTVTAVGPPAAGVWGRAPTRPASGLQHSSDRRRRRACRGGLDPWPPAEPTVQRDPGGGQWRLLARTLARSGRALARGHRLLAHLFDARDERGRAAAHTVSDGASALAGRCDERCDGTGLQLPTFGDEAVSPIDGLGAEPKIQADRRTYDRTHAHGTMVGSGIAQMIASPHGLRDISCGFEHSRTVP